MTQLRKSTDNTEGNKPSADGKEILAKLDLTNPSEISFEQLASLTTEERGLMLELIDR